MSRTRLEWAKWIISKHEGILAFILETGSKRPLGGVSWYQYQTTDPNKLSKWFEVFPNCNYGLHLGDGYIVVDLDIDSGKTGISDFKKICAEHGISDFFSELNTLMVRTPRNGYHLYFKVPFACANMNKFSNGIDVRGAIGYVVGPGSEIEGIGKYEIVDENAPIMDAPDWLVENYLVEPGYKDPNHDIPLVEWDLPESIEQAEEWIKYVEPAVQGNNGDDHTYEICCGLRDFGVSEAEAFRILNDSGWNEKCDPSWGDGELEIKIANSYRFAQNRPGCESHAFKVQRLGTSRPGGGFAELSEEQISELFHPKSLLERFDAGEDIPAQVEDDDIPSEVPDDNDILLEEDKKEDEQFWYGFEEFIKLEKIREYIVSDWLLAHGITGIIAKRNTGKSVLALDLSCHLACDMSWQGLPTMEGWCVIYICGEDDEGMILNGRAWVQHYNTVPSSDRFRVATNIISLAKDKEVHQRILEMKEWARGRRCVVVLDTWQRATAGLPKTEEELERAIQRAEIIARALDGPLIACFHPPKDGRMTIRNSAVQEDTTSGIWTLEEEADGIKLEVERIKGSGKNNYRKFHLKKIQVGGVDALGKPIEGIVPIKFAGTEDENSPKQITAHEIERGAWAMAVRGCHEFPKKENSFNVIKLNKDAVAQMIARGLNPEGDKDAKAFNTRYLGDIVLGGYAINIKNNITGSKLITKILVKFFHLSPNFSTFTFPDRRILSLTTQDTKTDGRIFLIN